MRKKMDRVRLELAESVQNMIQKILEMALKIESVGLLFGKKIENLIQIIDFIEMENLDSSPNSFSIDYSMMVKHIESNRIQNLQLLGFFHSHPNSLEAYPSERDKEFMNYWPFPYIWLIGTRSGVFSAFFYQNNSIRRLEYHII